MHAGVLTTRFPTDFAEGGGLQSTAIDMRNVQNREHHDKVANLNDKVGPSLGIIRFDNLVLIHVIRGNKQTNRPHDCWQNLEQNDDQVEYKVDVVESKVEVDRCLLHDQRRFDEKECHRTEDDYRIHCHEITIPRLVASLVSQAIVVGDGNDCWIAQDHSDSR